MRKSVTHRMDDDQVLAMGVLEPIVVLLLIAVIATLLELAALAAGQVSRSGDSAKSVG